MQITSDDFTRIAEGFYEAALQPELWRSALDDMSDVLGADGTCLLSWPGLDGGAIWSEKLDELVRAFFEGGWHARNLRMSRAVALRHTRKVLREQDLFTRDELDKLPFNAEFINKQGYRWVAGTFIAEGPSAMTAFVAERRARAQPFGAAEVELMRHLRPHMCRAAGIAGRLAEAKDIGALDAFEQLGCAAILLDFLGRSQRMNQRARKFLGDAIIVTDGQLATAHKDSNPAFQQLIGELLQPVPSASGMPILAHLPRPDARPLIAYGMPVPRSAQEIFHHSRAILVMVDPDENQSPPEIVLRHGFKLTPAECRLTLALGEGATVSEFAARQGISVGTARIQLKAVMAKMATRRQSELVALLARLSRAHANG